MDKDIFGPILDILFATMPRDNLLGSACLEFFEFIKKEAPLKELVKHLVPKYRQQFEELSSLETFRMMLLQYDQTQGFTAPADFMLDSDEEAAKKQTTHGRMMEQLHVDPAEEEYWNGSDDEEESAGAVSEKVPVANGASPATRQLVDYLSDGDDEEEMEGREETPGTPDTEKTIGKAEAEEGTKPEDEATAVGASTAESEGQEAPGSPQEDEPSEATSPASSATLEAGQVPAPPRLSEKRRREEDDDDDEMGKMMQNKRRNSKGVASNAAAQTLLKRKGSFNGNNGGPGKIAISISSTTTAGLRSNEES